MAKYREVIAKLRPGNALPDAPGECWVLARAHEGLAFEYAGAGETAKAIESLYSVAVLTLLFDDPRMRGRALATVADLRESAGDSDEARKDLTTAALAFEAAGDAAEAKALRDRRDGRPSAEGLAVHDVRRTLAQMMSGVAGDAASIAGAAGAAGNVAPAGAADMGTGAGPEGDSDGSPGADDDGVGEGDVLDAESVDADAGETGDPVDWGGVLARVGSGDVSDSPEDGVGADDLLRHLLNSAGEADGPDDGHIRRGAPLLVGMAGDDGFDAPAFADALTLAAKAVAAIGDGGVREEARAELEDGARTVWTAALTTGDEALMAGDAATARDAFEFVLESHSMPVRATSAQQGAAIVGRARAAIGSRDQTDIRESALNGANAVCRLPDAGDRARYGEQLATVLRDVNDATTLRMKLLGRVAENWNQVGDEHSEVRCLLGAALCKAKLQDFKGAHEDFLQLRLRAQELRDMALYSETLLHLGRSWAYAGRPQVAVQCYDAIVDRVTQDDLEDDRARVGYARLLLEKARTLPRIPGIPASAMTAAWSHAVEARDIFADVGAQGLVREANEMIRVLPR